MYVQFVYGPLKICNKTWGKCSVSMSADPVNTKYKGQQPTKEVLNNELERYFISIKQSIDVKNQSHPTGTLASTFLNPTGEANPYVQF